MDALLALMPRGLRDVSDPPVSVGDLGHCVPLVELYQSIRLLLQNGTCLQQDRPLSQSGYCLRHHASLFICVIVVCFCLLTSFLIQKEMEQAISTLNPLSIQLNNFKDFWAQAGHLGLMVWKSKFSILCRNEWPTLNVG